MKGSIIDQNGKEQMVRKIKIGSLLVFIVAAIFTTGYHASDEHYQIIEFAQYRLGIIEGSQLSWEFAEKMRPSLQPWIAYVGIKSFHAIGINNPFFIALIFRLLSALIAWFVIGKLNDLLAERYFPNPPWKTFFYFCAYLLWFVPYISVRFSSENFAAIALLCGLYFLLKKDRGNKEALVVGIFLGLSVLFRYQMGMAVAGIGIYLLFVAKYNFRKLAIMAVSFGAVMLAGAWMDYVFYNGPVFTAFNYFKLNLIEGRASDFGTKPFWFYFLYFILVGIPPLSLILFLGFFNGIIKLRAHLFSFLIIPFVAIHLLIPHKEIRFLFPVMYPFIFLAVYGLKAYFEKKQIKSYVVKIFKVGVILNCIVLAFRIFLPANEKISYYRYLYNNIDKGDRLILTTEKDAYQLSGKLNISFYLHPSGQSLYFADMDSLHHYLLEQDIKTCFLLQRDYSPVNLAGYTLEKAYSIYPAALKKIANFDIEKRIKPWTIYIVKKL